jgi:hypothetical protein
MIETIDDMGRLLMQKGTPVDTGHWQSLKGTPHAKSFELSNAIYQLGLPVGDTLLAAMVAPNLPWAEDHFQERVGGLPTNPGEEYKNWPWYDPNWEAQGGDLQEFSHTYQERFWPKQIPHPPSLEIKGHRDMLGIRYRYGDLNDVVALLAREPHTRQAYLPIWFPEDTGAHHGGRVPCSLGYHLLLRDGKLHINYFIRSCDFLRYFRDDVYMAGRLCQWIVNAVHDQGPPGENNNWNDVVPGTLTMFISSLHVFEGDLPKMRKLYG